VCCSRHVKQGGKGKLRLKNGKYLSIQAYGLHLSAEHTGFKFSDHLAETLNGS
jgi:hypothetical protein